MDKLPPELLFEIADNLCSRHIVNLRASCKAFDSKLTPLNWNNVYVISDQFRDKFPCADFAYRGECKAEEYEFRAYHDCEQRKMKVLYEDLRYEDRALDYFLNKLRFCTRLTLTDDMPSVLGWFIQILFGFAGSILKLELYLNHFTSVIAETLCQEFSRIDNLKLHIKMRYSWIPDFWEIRGFRQFLDSKLINLQLTFDEERPHEMFQFLTSGNFSNLKSFTLVGFRPGETLTIITIPTLNTLLSGMPNLCSLHLEIPVYNPSHIQWIPSTLNHCLSLKMPSKTIHSNDPTIYGERMTRGEEQQDLSALPQQRIPTNVCRVRKLRIISPNKFYPTGGILEDFDFPCVRALSIRSDTPFLSASFVNRIQELEIIDYSTNTATVPDIFDFTQLVSNFCKSVQYISLRCSPFAVFDSIEGMTEFCNSLMPADYPNLRFVNLSFVRTLSSSSKFDMVNTLVDLRRRYGLDFEAYLAVPCSGETTLGYEPNMVCLDYLPSTCNYLFPINHPTFVIPFNVIDSTSQEDTSLSRFGVLILPRNNPWEFNNLGIIW